MGTRADFYVGRGETAEWIGSIGYDGYPEDQYKNGVSMGILAARNEVSFRKRVQKYLAQHDGIFVNEGWPWPWEDSGTSDYAYAWDGWMVWRSSFGHAWMPATSMPHKSASDEEKNDFDMKFGGNKQIFPNMKSIQNIARGPKSGVITITQTPTGMVVE